MKLTLTSTFFLVSITTPLTAQLPKSNETPKALESNETAKTSPTANALTLEALNHVKSIFTNAATATNEKKATAAAAQIKATAEKIVALQIMLKATPMPNATEKKKLAKKMIQYELQVAIIIKKMTNTFSKNTEEVNSIIQPAFTAFQNKAKQTMTLISIYYPEKEMNTYIKELKEK